MIHLKYLNKFLWKYKKILLLGLIFILVTNIFAIYPAEFVRIALDELLEKLNSQNNDNVSFILLKYGLLIVLFADFVGKTFGVHNGRQFIEPDLQPNSHHISLRYTYLKKSLFQFFLSLFH